MDKETILNLLRDSEIRREIFKIVCGEFFEIAKKEGLLDTTEKIPEVEEKIIEPVIAEKIVEPVIEEKIVEPVVEEKIVKPVVEEKIIEPVIEEKIIEPVIEEKITEPEVEEVEQADTGFNLLDEELSTLTDTVDEEIVNDVVNSVASQQNSSIRDLVNNLLVQTQEETPPEPEPEEEKSPLSKNFQALKNTVIKEQIYNRRRTNEQAEPIDKFTLVLERQCPVCGYPTRVVKCKTRLIVDKRDLDSCVHYHNFNPYLYNVWACETCGFAAEESRFLSPMPKHIREHIKSFLLENSIVTPFLRERNVAEAMSFYEMAILFCEVFEPSFARQAGLYQKMAWIQRYEGDKDKELEYLQKTVNLYEESFGKERYPVGNVTETAALYYTGSTYFMMNDFEKATTYLKKLIDNRNIRSVAPNLYDNVRDILLEIKRTTETHKKKK